MLVMSQSNGTTGAWPRECTRRPPSHGQNNWLPAPFMPLRRDLFH
jgi:hypothetical protein